MKTSLLILAALTSAALAQQPQAVPVRRINLQNQSPQLSEAFADNYLVTLSVTENEKALTEVVIATARPEFKADSFDPTLVFSGSLAPLEDGTVLVSYQLAAEIAVPVTTQQSLPASGEPGAVKTTSIQYKTQSAQSQVRLKLGEPLNVLRTGQRTYRLTVSKLPAGGAKAH